MLIHRQNCTLRMHLAENIYLSMAKETTTFSLWEKLQVMYEKKSSSIEIDIDIDQNSTKINHKFLSPITHHATSQLQATQMFSWPGHKESVTIELKYGPIIQESTTQIYKCPIHMFGSHSAKLSHGFEIPPNLHVHVWTSWHQQGSWHIRYTCSHSSLW